MNTGQSVFLERPAVPAFSAHSCNLMDARPSPFVRSAWLAAALLFGCGGLSLIRRGYAERLAASADANDVEHALRLAPENPAFWLRRADLLDRELKSPADALRHAAELNPFDADTWIRLGLDAEVRGDYAQAEAHLLHAARVSRRYQPRWTLANYYFRRGSADEFWKWARLSLDLDPEFADAVFQLCWRMPVPANEILARAIPPRRAVWRKYARFLLSQNRINPAGDVLKRMLPDVEPEDRDLLLEASDRFLAADSVDLATAAWNGLCGGRAVTCSTVRDSGGMPLDAAESVDVLAHGFAWHTVNSPGIWSDLHSGAVSVEFSGKEPESAEILWRWIPVKSGQRGTLRFEYQSPDFAPASGINWQLLAAGSIAPLASSPWLSNRLWTEVQLPFEVPAGVDLMRLRLNYARQPGSVRLQGSLTVRALRIELAP